MSFENIDTASDLEDLGADPEKMSAKDRDALAAVVNEAPEEEQAEAKADADKPRDKLIPRERFDEVNTKYKAEQEERARLQAELDALKNPAAPAFDLDGKVEAYLTKLNEADEALLEGDTEKRKVLIREANAINDEIQNAKLQAVRQSAIEETEARFSKRENESRVMSLAEQVVADYPFLDTDDKALAEVMKWRDFYVTMDKMSFDQALRRAADEIAPKFAPAGVEAHFNEIATKRAQEAVAKAAATANRQPANPTLAGVGNRAQPTVPDVNGMKQDEWDRLPQGERDKLLM